MSKSEEQALQNMVGSAAPTTFAQAVMQWFAQRIAQRQFEQGLISDSRAEIHKFDGGNRVDQKPQARPEPEWKPSWDQPRAAEETRRIELQDRMLDEQARIELAELTERLRKAK